MEPEPDVLSAAQLDAMTPNQRRDEFRRHLVRDSDGLSEALRSTILETTRLLVEDRRSR